MQHLCPAPPSTYIVDEVESVSAALFWQADCGGVRAEGEGQWGDSEDDGQVLHAVDRNKALVVMVKCKDNAESCTWENGLKADVSRHSPVFQLE